MMGLASFQLELGCKVSVANAIRSLVAFEWALPIPEGDNHGYYGNRRVDELIELARVEFDLEKRKKLYHDIHRLINEDQPYTFVNSVPEKLAVSKRIRNVVISKSGPFDFHPGANYWSISSATMEAKK